MENQETYVYGNKRTFGGTSTLRFENINISISYGAKEIKLPFQ